MHGDAGQLVDGLVNIGNRVFHRASHASGSGSHRTNAEKAKEFTAIHRERLHLVIEAIPQLGDRCAGVEGLVPPVEHHHTRFGLVGSIAILFTPVPENGKGYSVNVLVRGSNRASLSP